MLVSKSSESVLLTALSKSSELIEFEAKHALSDEAKLAYELIAEMLQYASYRKESPLLHRLYNYVEKGTLKTYQEMSRENAVYCALCRMIFFNESQNFACKFASKHTDCSTDVLRKMVPTKKGKELKDYLEEERAMDLFHIDIKFTEYKLQCETEIEAARETIIHFAKTARNFLKMHKISQANETEIDRLLFCTDEEIIDTL